MAGKLLVHSAENLNFPYLGKGDGSVVNLPEAELWSGINQQGTVESTSYDLIFSEDSNLLNTCTELRFHSRPSLDFTDLRCVGQSVGIFEKSRTNIPHFRFNIFNSDSYLMVECHLTKSDGTAPVDASNVVPANFVTSALFRDLQINICGCNINR